MLKKLARITLSMIFGSLILMNVSFAIASASVRAEAEAKIGNKFEHPGSPTACLCTGDECTPCATLPDAE